MGTRLIVGDSRLEKAVFLLAYVVLIAWAVVSLFPLLWMITTAFKPTSLVIATPPDLIPSHLTTRNFQVILDAGVFRWTLNSLIVCSIVTFAQLLFSSMAGYAFAKKQFPGKNVLFWVYISSMMVPIYALIVPLYGLIDRLGLLDTYVALIMPGLAAPFGVFLMRQFIQTLPSELIDAARVDGASEWGVYWRIILPLSTSGLAVLGIFIFADQWGSFFWPLVVTGTSSMNVLPVGIASLQQFDVTSGVKDYGVMMAGATWSAIPMFAIFFLFQRYFVRGVTLGALKG